MNIHEKLLHLRQNRFSKVITKKEIAQRLGKHVQLYMKYEDGETKANIELIENLSIIYGLSPNYFFENSFGRVSCLTPYFKDYDHQKKRFLYEEDGLKTEEYETMDNDVYGQTKYTRAMETVLNHEGDPTNFFFCEVDPEKLGKSNLAFHLLFDDYNDRVRLHENFPSRPKDESITLLDFSDLSKFTLITKKANIDDVFTQKYNTIYLVHDINTHDILLALVEKKEDGISIIPVYDIKKDCVVSYKYAEDDFQIFNDIHHPTVIKSLKDEYKQVKDIEFLGKVISMYDVQKNNTLLTDSLRDCNVKDRC